MKTTEHALIEAGNNNCIFQAIDIILTKPEIIRQETIELCKKYYKDNQGTKSKAEIDALIVKKIISDYSYYAGFSGGASALTGIIPGIGSVAAILGGVAADLISCLKYQIEMVMAIAVVYGKDIRIEAQKNICAMIVGLNAQNFLKKENTKALGRTACLKITRQYLKGATLKSVKSTFKGLGLRFTRKGFEKSIPFGVGCAVCFFANKIATTTLGNRANELMLFEQQYQDSTENSFYKGRLFYYFANFFQNTIQFCVKKF